jgi:hypothetical protein
MTQLQYYATLSFSISCILGACVGLAHYARARWKWVIVPVFLVGLALIVVLTVTAWAQFSPGWVVPQAAPQVEIYPDYFPPAPLRLWWVEGTA